MMWQEWIVTAIVALAAGYALWYWMPGALRQRLGVAQPALAKAPECGACSACGGCAAPTPASATKAYPQARPPIWMASER